MGRAILILVVILVLSGLLAMTAFASYSGAGLVAAGAQPSARSGSSGGVIILGGGPGSGK
jgi:hypothetical protein